MAYRLKVFSRDSVERRKAGEAVAEKIYTRKEREKATSKIREQREGKGRNIFVERQLKELQKPGAKAVYNNGIVTGVRDAKGRLTGYDVAEIEKRMQEKMNKDRPSATERRLLALEQQISATPTKPKDPAPTTVKRSDLAQKIEAERARRRKLGLSPLGNRSLLSNASTLGVA